VTVLDQEIHRLRRSLDQHCSMTRRLPRDELEELDTRDLIADLEGLLRPPYASAQKIALTSVSPERARARVLGTAPDADVPRLKQGAAQHRDQRPRGDAGRGTLALGVTPQLASGYLDRGQWSGDRARTGRQDLRMHFTTKPADPGSALHVAWAVVESSGGQIPGDLRDRPRIQRSGSGCRR